MSHVYNEMGGFLPLELNGGLELYSGRDVVALNAARYAIVLAMKISNFGKLFLPTYMCKSVFDALDRYAIPYCRYHINDSFEPVDVELNDNDCIMLVNYFGIVERNQMIKMVERFHNVIIDNTQAFYMEPILDAYNVYSCRKFFGVSDGAYLIKGGLGCSFKEKGIELPLDRSGNRMTAVINSVEYGTNTEYKNSLDAEESISNSDICLMSKLTHKLLQNVDYEAVKTVRVKNFSDLHNSLNDKISYSFEIPKRLPAPMIYPYLDEKGGLRKYLVTNRIYIPHWWGYLCEEYELSDFESKLVNGIVPLPIDQRYGKADMMYLSEMIHQYYI